MKQDLKEYSDNELSLIVFNDESCYLMRRQILRHYEQNKPSILNDWFEFTDDQLETLIQDIKDDLNESDEV